MTAPVIRLELEIIPDRATEYICEICGARREWRGICTELVADKENIRFMICTKCAASGPQKTGKNLRERVRYLRLKASKLERLAAALSRAKSGPLTQIFQAAATIGTEGKEVR
jgi:ribosomal protein L40E